MKKRSRYNTSGFLWWLSSGSARDVGDMGSIPGLGRLSGEGNGNPLQYPCLGNPMNREAWQASVHGVTKESDTTKLLNNNNKSMLVIRPTVGKIKQVSEKGNFIGGVEWLMYSTGLLVKTSLKR